MVRLWSRAGRFGKGAHAAPPCAARARDDAGHGLALCGSSDPPEPPMPELPEVETVRRGLAPALEGRTILRGELRRPDLRFPFPARFAERLAGRTVTSLGRRAKYLLADLDDGEVLVMHLGMTGRFAVERPGGKRDEPGEFYYDTGRLPAHDHVILHLDDGARIVFNDVRRFGYMDLVARADLASCRHFRDMGLEPTGNDFDGEALARMFRGRLAPLKAALLDQRLVAGLGNIYVCEALHRAGLSPARAAGTLVTEAGRPGAACERLAQAIREVIAEAIRAGGSTLRDYRHADGTPGAFQEEFRAYGREGEPCPTPGCRGVIRWMVQSGRSTFYCEACQG
jgi:formamidopyrimidine-DNA glycosylase